MRMNESGSERITISLPTDLGGRLRAQSRASGKAVSSIVKDAVERYYAEQAAPTLPSFTGIGDSGTTDTSARAEELVGQAILNEHTR